MLAKALFGNPDNLLLDEPSPADITGEGADVSAFAANHTDAGGLPLFFLDLFTSTAYLP